MDLALGDLVFVRKLTKVFFICPMLIFLALCTVGQPKQTIGTDFEVFHNAMMTLSADHYMKVQFFLLYCVEPPDIGAISSMFCRWSPHVAPAIRITIKNGLNVDMDSSN